MSSVDGSAKRGPKERIGLKSMTVEEKREYDRTRQKLHRLQKKQNESERTNNQQPATSTEQTPDETEGCSSDDEIDFCTGNTAAAAAIMNIVRNSPKKKMGYIRGLIQKMEDYFVKYNLNNAEILDVFVVLVRAFSVEIIDMLKEKGVEIVTIPKSLKRHDFSQLPKSSRHNHKERLLAHLQSVS